jgi:hypothetical protein
VTLCNSTMNAPGEFDFRYLSLQAAANLPTKVGTLTHAFYRYPARFGEAFVREAVESFSKAGQTVLDPFCGGGTTVVEALSLGRAAIGNDLSHLAGLVTKAKTTPLSVAQLEALYWWVQKVSASPLELLLRSKGHYDEQLTGLPIWHRRLIAGLTERIADLPRGDSRTFAKCLVLKAAQWAYDGKESLPQPSDILRQLPSAFEEMRVGMEAYTSRLVASGSSKRAVIRNRQLLTLRASQLHNAVRPESVSLVVTSPPYLGVHVLYHRWQLQGRRELRAPFFISGCEDLGGASKYTIIARASTDHTKYFGEVADSFAAVRETLKPNGCVIQLVSFCEADQSLPRYLDAMDAAGLQLCESYVHTAGELAWRAVPSRRWYARVKAVQDSSAAQEVLLVHRRGR